MLRTLEESRASNSKCHLDSRHISEIHSEFSENVDKSNPVNKNTNIVPRCLSAAKTFNLVKSIMFSNLTGQ